nr:MAG TPA: hypothetical protein [Caudoviricetes sp.]
MGLFYATPFGVACWEGVKIFTRREETYVSLPYI